MKEQKLRFNSSELHSFVSGQSQVGIHESEKYFVIESTVLTIPSDIYSCIIGLLHAWSLPVKQSLVQRRSRALQFLPLRNSQNSEKEKN